ncbi:hypothetical protein I302_101270 [Kwoniella bestiolae CBS 10118]|uniref:Uncharacterized protein n=1 Tax=Kwoniella bestiolae CBS 10118 TaxID=1296100 RepID=A0A1B9G7G9_9TREE|nr:hypothetical protein I302_04644 [Kwoniella bestiolae CBS 10118]OCF26953.1 hypothetical protein I302_04644 [Kwoniella bestiolae CBS 10118]
MGDMDEDEVNIMDQRSIRQRYRLVSPLPSKNFDLEEDDYSPVTLVELVGVMKERRKKELEEKSVDLLTF